MEVKFYEIKIKEQLNPILFSIETNKEIFINQLQQRAQVLPVVIIP